MAPNMRGDYSKNCIKIIKDSQMAANRKLPDITTLVRLRQMGWTLDQIAEEYDVTRTGVWKALERGGQTNPIATYKDVVPWRVAVEHQATACMIRLRSLVKQRQGLELPETEGRLLREWLQGMEDAGVVLNYHPEAPPNPASAKGGFYYVPREAGDVSFYREPVR